jgi:hypothetical protein
MNSASQKNTNYYFLLGGLAFYLIVGFSSSSLPFFWDMVNFSRMAQYYLSVNFHQMVVPEHIDDGHPPLFILYLASCWKIFGKSLFVFHMCILPFMFGVLWEYFKMARKWIHPGAIPIAIVLLCIEPTYLSQSIIGGQDIIIVYFLLLAVNSISEGKKTMYGLSLLILSLLNLRGFLLVFPLGIYHLFIVCKLNPARSFLIQLKNKRAEFIPYIPVFSAIFFWGIYHYNIRGWAFFPPTRMAHRSLASSEQILRNCIYIIWKMIDFGRIIPFGILFISLIKGKLSKHIPHPFFMLIILITSFFFLSMAPLTNPIGHRYFIIVYLFVSIAVAQILYSFNRHQMQIVFSILIVFLLGGNFILYPEKYGNGWDSSLKFLPYFKVREKMETYIDKQRIDTKKIASGFPLRAEPRYSKLNNTSYFICDKDSLVFTSFDYILQSNVCNTFTEAQINVLHSATYQKLADYESGQVYIRLYKKTGK